jgi:hypothetical protein
MMYKPLFLGISNADPKVVYGILIILLIWLATAAGFALWFIGHCVGLSWGWIRKQLIRNSSNVQKTTNP